LRTNQLFVIIKYPILSSFIIGNVNIFWLVKKCHQNITDKIKMNKILRKIPISHLADTFFMEYVHGAF